MGCLTATLTRVGGDMTASLGLVCGTKIGLPVLYCKDGAVLTIDGEYILLNEPIENE